MNRLGVWSASALCVIGVAYVVTLAVGFASAGFAKPIVDPVLAVMEILTLLSAPILVVLMAAVHAYAAPQYKVHSLVAFAFMVLMAGLTSSVHFVELTAVRQSATASLTWPSTAYALELLAWDLFWVFRCSSPRPCSQQANWRARYALAFTSPGHSVWLASSARRAEKCAYSSSPSRAMRVFYQRCSCCWRCYFAAPGSRARPTVTEKPPDGVGRTE